MNYDVERFVISETVMETQGRKAGHALFIVRCISSLIFYLCISHCLCAVGYGFTEQDVSDYIAFLQAPNCTVSKKPFTTDGKLGYSISRTCFHPERIKSTSSIISGEVCKDGYGYYFPGGPHPAPGGCSGGEVWSADACDNTSNYVQLSAGTMIYRACRKGTLTTYCDGRTEQTDGQWLDLGIWCYYITKSPCPIQALSNVSCNDTEDLASFYPVCKEDDPDPCCADPAKCGEKDPRPDEVDDYACFDDGSAAFAGDSANGAE
jgi:hypothetical protein